MKTWNPNRRDAMKHASPRLLLGLAAVVLAGACATSSPPAPAAGANAPESPLRTLRDNTALSRGASYRFLPGDELDVQDLRRAELHRAVRVDGFGKIQYPHAGEVRAQGCTSRELADKLTDALVKSGQYRQLNLTVSLTSPAQEAINVIGEVYAPGQQMLRGNTGILDALARAGGTTHDAKLEKILLFRGALSPPGMVVVDASTLLKPGKQGPSTDLASFTLVPGDVLVVPSTVFSDVERYFRRINILLDPILNVERGVVLYPDVESVLRTGDLKPSTTSESVLTTADKTSTTTTTTRNILVQP